jgi:gamma-glutamylcyclotransferase (GGCT)/AIG2-like uncharacterized protein YtfP
MEKVQNLFVYGTLKHGGKWHHLLSGQVFLGEDYIHGDMYMDKGGYYPVLYQGEGLVQGEVYGVDGLALESVKELEVDAGYDYVQTLTRSGDAVSVFCYTDSSPEGLARIETFDAVSCFRRWLEATPRDSDNYLEFINRGGQDPTEISS